MIKKSPRGRVVRPEDALETLARKARETDPAKRRVLTDEADLDLLFGTMNKRRGFTNAGRPVGTTRLRRGDKAALNFMECTATETGETRPYTLASLAWRAGHGGQDPGQYETTRNRWAAAWKRLHHD